MNEISVKNEDNLDIMVPAKVMLNSQAIEQLSTSLKVQRSTETMEDQPKALPLQPNLELNPQLVNLNEIKVREAIPCGTTKQLTTNVFEVQGIKVDAPLDGLDAKGAKQEAERIANELADTLIKAMKDNYTCADKKCVLKFSFEKIQIGKTQFYEQAAILATSVRHKAEIRIQGKITIQCVPRWILV